MASLPIIDRILAYCEPSPSGITIDNSGKEPDEFKPKTLYGFSEAEDAIVNDETGPARLERFQVTVIYMGDALDEEPQMNRQATVTTALSSKRDAYLAALADRDSIDLWDHIDAEADMDWTTTFEGRAVAIRVNGYRYLT